MCLPLLKSLCVLSSSAGQLDEIAVFVHRHCIYTQQPLQNIRLCTQSTVQFTCLAHQLTMVTGTSHKSKGPDSRREMRDIQDGARQTSQAEKLRVGLTR